MTIQILELLNEDIDAILPLENELYHKPWQKKDYEYELNDNNNIKFTVIPTSNFSREDVINFMIEISKKLSITSCIKFPVSIDSIFNSSFSFNLSPYLI